MVSALGAMRANGGSARLVLEFGAKPVGAGFFRARVFEEPLVPVGKPPSVAENAALAVALVEYSKRTDPDDLSSLTPVM